VKAAQEEVARLATALKDAAEADRGSEETQRLADDYGRAQAQLKEALARIGKGARTQQ
jgi:hypothetical protein